jgi:hypothetical protein
MAITKNVSRQELLVAYVDINLADVVSAADGAAIDLPPNAVIVSGNIVTTEAWNSTSTDVFDVGDAVSQNRYLNDGNIRSLAADVPLVPTGYEHPGGALTVRWTSGGGSPSTGKARLTVMYYIAGRAETTYG